MAGAEDLTPQEIAAALAARRELGPDYEHEIASSLADRMERRVKEELDIRRGEQSPAQREHESNKKHAEQQTGIAIASVLAGAATTIAAVGESGAATLVGTTWIGIAAINVVFAISRRRRD